MGSTDRVVSEVHSFSNEYVSQESHEAKAVLSRFEFSFPQCMCYEMLTDDSVQPIVDKDGDLEVIRKSSSGRKDGGVIIIEHQSSTTLDLVGEQVWRGAFYLSDFVLHNWRHFKDASVLEVASGVGLTSVVAAMVAKKVVATDIDRGEILDLLRRNLDRNRDLCVADTFVKMIDFYNLDTVDAVSSLIQDVDIILAADVVYNDKLTDAFFDAIFLLLKPNRIIYIALEKRYVFTIEDLDTVAPCYEYFVSKLDWLKSKLISKVMTLRVEEVSREEVPQYFVYERTKELVLWKISVST